MKDPKRSQMKAKKPGAKRSIQVFAHWEGIQDPHPMGILHALPGRGKEIFSFEYEPQWLDSGEAQTLDPALNLMRRDI